jgi:hypothetical protein
MYVLRRRYQWLFTQLILLVARAHGGKEVWAGDRHAGMPFEQLKRFPKIAKEMQSPTDVVDAQRLWDKCRGDHRRQAFLDYRDKYLAHLGEANQGPPKYGDVFGFARATAAALKASTRDGRHWGIPSVAAPSSQGQRKKTLGPLSTTVMDEIKNERSLLCWLY